MLMTLFWIVMVTKLCNPLQNEFGYRPKGSNLSPFACEAEALSMSYQDHKTWQAYIVAFYFY